MATSLCKGTLRVYRLNIKFQRQYISNHKFCVFRPPKRLNEQFLVRKIPLD